jgi:hypothetical protein
MDQDSGGRSLARGEIDRDTPIRLGPGGASSFIRDLPEFVDPLVAFSSADLTPVWDRRKRNSGLPITFLILIAVVCVGTRAGIPFRRPTKANLSRGS